MKAAPARERLFRVKPQLVKRPVTMSSYLVEDGFPVPLQKSNHGRRPHYNFQLSITYLPLAILALAQYNNDD